MIVRIAIVALLFLSVGCMRERRDSASPPCNKDQKLETVWTNTKTISYIYRVMDSDGSTHHTSIDVIKPGHWDDVCTPYRPWKD